MANFYRLAALLLAFFAASSSFATITRSTVYYVQWSAPFTTPPFLAKYQTQAQACAVISAAAIAVDNAVNASGLNPWTLISGDQSGTGCVMRHNNRDYANESFFFGLLTDSVVPDHAKCEGSVCTCDPGYRDEGGVCKPVAPVNNCPKAGTNAGQWTGPGRLGPKSVCSDQAHSGNPDLPGCMLNGHADFAYGDGGDPEIWKWSTRMAYTGAQCKPQGGNGGQDSGSPDQGKQCTPPQVVGTFNGQTVCYTPATDPSKSQQSQQPKKTTTTSNPDGTSTKTETGAETFCTGGRCTTTTTTTTTTTNTDGTQQPSKTTTATSTCIQGPGCSITIPRVDTTTSTTTTTTATSGNSSSSTSTSTTTSTNTSTGGGGSGNSGQGGGTGTDQDGDGEKDPSMFAGACDVPPVCQGDAIMCAVAAATFQTNCVLSDPKKPTPLYDAAITKTGDQTTGSTLNSTVTVGSNSFDQTELLGAAVGMSDISVTVFHSTVSVPFSSVNVWLARLGAIFQAVTFLLCARIVVRG